MDTKLRDELDVRLLNELQRVAVLLRVLINTIITSNTINTITTKEEN